MILACGESLMDVYRRKDSPEDEAVRLGGSPWNVAIALARLGVRAGYLGSISLDAHGERLLDTLHREGVWTGAVWRTSHATTRMLVSVDEDGLPSYTFDGSEGADRMLPPEALRLLPASLRGIACGSYAMVVEPIATTLRRLVAERRHAFLAFDANVRLAVEPDIARWRSAVAWAAGCAALVKLSEEDLALLEPGADPGTWSRTLLDAGVACVVVTRGAHGALAVTRAHEVEVPATPVEIVDAVGAGDTFQAALIAWLAARGLLDRASLEALPGDTLTLALAFASRAAARTCARKGADPPRLSPR